MNIDVGHMYFFVLHMHQIHSVQWWGLFPVLVSEAEVFFAECIATFGVGTSVP